MIYGILIIAISWIFLASRFYRNRLGIDPWFLRLYALGALIIFLDSFSFRHFGLGLLPAASAVNLAVPLYILWKVGK
ncbi:MAG: hypothetical protein A2556_01485 [Candidatus Vogelbacteria bacterium RIFOXYD2_FULL_44_9]|uniref:Uncharacterized protein n=1 Tax=Candidatus Vogelbacteria bacterium RIFOXYD2_FULL_44_9 TaxID=1802441 RepID=A0A1G2QMI7_9BACT|nr:MAG: hypothetical protein A2556_01485 [Candidatus Vogelbacteria bacterium RIFOXYD2_FULL_44_9]